VGGNSNFGVAADLEQQKPFLCESSELLFISFKSRIRES
jgi:hypothetical protein